MNSLDTLRARRDEILRIAMRHGAQNVRVFGSVARGEATSIALAIVPAVSGARRSWTRI
jgi:predicted nucleotidyltransferase